MQPTPKKKKTTQRFSHPAGRHGERSTAKIGTYLSHHERVEQRRRPSRPPYAKVLSLSRTRNPHAVNSIPPRIYRRKAKVNFSFKSQNLAPLFSTHAIFVSTFDGRDRWLRGELKIFRKTTNYLPTRGMVSLPSLERFNCMIVCR
jgi:hypothetical protein